MRRCECGRRIWPWQGKLWDMENAAFIHASCAFLEDKQ